MRDIHELTECPDKPRFYEIRVMGHLNHRWIDRFECLTITLEKDGDTLLTGPVVDQAALHGLLKKVRDLGMPLVSVKPIKPGAADAAPPARPDVKSQNGVNGLFAPIQSQLWRQKVNTYRINSAMAGALYVLGTVFGVLGGVFGGELIIGLISSKPLAGMELLNIVAADSSRLIVGAFMILMMGISLAAMTLFLYPVFRKDSDGLALGLVLFRGALEGCGYFMTAIGVLTLAMLGAESIVPGADLAVLQPIGNILYQFLNVKTPIGTIFFIIGATCLYASFYRTRLIPRWLAIWGLIGAVPYLANALLHFFHMENVAGTYLEIPLGIQELVMGLWLIIKGFNQAALKILDQAH